MQMSFERSLFDPHMVVQAMRDSRYRHPANAIAELIDNSIDARATNVEVLIREEWTRVNTREQRRVSELAVLDDGHGMSAETLVKAVRFGGREETQAIRKIGKYGMGLPTASVSQCRRFDVWSWEHDINRAVHSYIDLDEIEMDELTEIPEPTGKPVPQDWLNLADSNSLDPNQGTLVVWSKPDRIGGMRAQTIFNQIEEEIGRIYRHYINDGELTIRMAAVRPDESAPYIDEPVEPNDPLYLMHNSATPAPWNKEPMFQPYTIQEYVFNIKGRQERVEIVYSIARQDALGEYRTDRPGNTDHGRHARKNIGISVIRENREIVLENYFIRGGARGGGNSAPENRWWGCEVRFDRGCDDLFGVDHNKQMVSQFSRAVKDLFDSDSSDTELLDELDIEEDDANIHNIVSHIRNTTRAMLRELEQKLRQRPAKASSGGGSKTPEEEAAQAASEVTEESIQTGEVKPTQTDMDRTTLSEEERIEAEATHLVEEGFERDEAEKIATELVRQKLNYNFEHSDLSGYQMFKVVSRGGILNVQLNINHAAYNFIRVIEDEALQSGSEIARRAAVGIEVLLLAWARMEDEIEMHEKRIEFQDTGLSWGRMVHRVLSNLPPE